MPLQIAKFLKKLPEAKIILGHMGGYFHVGDAIEALNILKELQVDAKNL